MDVEEWMGLLALLALIVFPAAALTIRLALKPIVEAILRLREGFVAAPAQEDDPRIARLEAEVELLRSEVARLGEVESFHRQLTEGSAHESAGRPDR